MQTKTATETKTKSGLSKEIEPRPLKEGQVATFKLVNAGKIDPATGLPSFNSGASFEGETKVYDKFLGDFVILKNKNGEEMVEVDGRKQILDKVDRVEFNAYGICKVKHNEPHKYIFLARHNNCANNKFRDNSVAPVWEQIIETNIKDKELIFLDLSHDAEGLIKNGDHNMVIAIGKALAAEGIVPVDLSSPIADIKRELRKYAKENPKNVIRASNDKLMRYQVDVLDAQAESIIQFSAEYNEWDWCDKVGPEKIITKVEPGYNPVEKLAEFMLQQEEENKKAPADKKIRTVATEIQKYLKALA